MTNGAQNLEMGRAESQILVTIVTWLTLIGQMSYSDHAVSRLTKNGHFPSKAAYDPFQQLMAPVNWTITSWVLTVESAQSQ